jgi:hypothetical protein
MPVKRYDFEEYVKPASYSQPPFLYHDASGPSDHVIIPSAVYGDITGGNLTMGNRAATWLRPVTQDPVTGLWETNNWFRPAFDANVTTGDTGFDDLCIPVMVFRGIDPSTSITIKRFVGFEEVPNQTSGTLPFVRTPAPYSPDAIKLYQLISRDMPNGLPASANGWGTILKTIGMVLSALSPVVTMIPKVGPVLGAITSVAGPVATKVSELDRSEKKEAAKISREDKAIVRTANAMKVRKQKLKSQLARQRRFYR